MGAVLYVVRVGALGGWGAVQYVTHASAVCAGVTRDFIIRGICHSKCCTVRHCTARLRNMGLAAKGLCRSQCTLPLASVWLPSAC